MRDLWHFHFYGKTPLALVHGRERIYFEHFWNDFAAIPPIRCRNAIADFTRKLMPDRAACAQASSTFARSSKTRRNSLPSQKSAYHADACSYRRKSFRRGPDSAGPACRERWKAWSFVTPGTGSWKKLLIRSSLNSSSFLTASPESSTFSWPAPSGLQYSGRIASYSETVPLLAKNYTQNPLNERNGLP